MKRIRKQEVRNGAERTEGRDALGVKENLNKGKHFALLVHAIFSLLLVFKSHSQFLYGYYANKV